MNSNRPSRKRKNSQLARGFLYYSVAYFAIVFSLIVSPWNVSAATHEGAIAQANQLELNGRFAAAADVLRKALTGNLSPADREKTEFELERLHRIRLDFSLTRRELFTALQQSVRDLTSDEFEQWIRQGRFDSRQIDGEQWFMIRSVSNLFWRYPKLNARELDAQDDSAEQKSRLQLCRAVKLAAQRQGQPYVLPEHLDASMTVTVDADAVSAGKIIRAWLPIPRDYPYQSHFEMVSSSSPAKEIAPADSPIRSAYFEQPAIAGAPTDFTLHFRYTRYSVWFDIDPKRVTAFDGKDALIAPFTHEAPHVIFTPEMRALSKQIVGEENNPARLAKKIYDWIGTNIRYSYAIEYSTIRNISDYCRSRRYGDCGQEAMLFITLCRLNNIPARWQSGWDAFTGNEDIHDWSEIYLAPYGWVPVDPCMGILAIRYMTALTPSEQQELHDFYFGGLDPWRMAANSDHSQILTPPKKSFRSDNVDFQRGEFECGEQNIYFNHYEYQFDVSEVLPIHPH